MVLPSTARRAPVYPLSNATPPRALSQPYRAENRRSAKKSSPGALAYRGRQRCVACRMSHNRAMGRGSTHAGRARTPPLRSRRVSEIGRRNDTTATRDTRRRARSRGNRYFAVGGLQRGGAFSPASREPRRKPTMNILGKRNGKQRLKSTFTLPGLPPTSNATPPRALRPYRAETGARRKRARRERSLIEGDNCRDRMSHNRAMGRGSTHAGRARTPPLRSRRVSEIGRRNDTTANGTPAAELGVVKKYL